VDVLYKVDVVYLALLISLLVADTSGAGTMLDVARKLVSPDDAATGQTVV